MLRRTLIRCAAGALALFVVLTPATPRAQGRGGLLAALEGSACVTPTGQAGTIAVTQSASGVAILRCRAGEGRFIANGDGTITDTQTGLMWETKVDGLGCLRCVFDNYTWDAAMGDWLDRLNGRLIASSDEGGFAGYSDWRLPTLAELRTIVQVGSLPTIDPIFGPTAPGLYWSASTWTIHPDPTFAFAVAFPNGNVNLVFKPGAVGVRAVRDGP